MVGLCYGDIASDFDFSKLIMVRTGNNYLPFNENVALGVQL